MSQVGHCQWHKPSRTQEFILEIQLEDVIEMPAVPSARLQVDRIEIFPLWKKKTTDKDASVEICQVSMQSLTSSSWDNFHIAPSYIDSNYTITLKSTFSSCLLENFSKWSSYPFCSSDDHSIWSTVLAATEDTNRYIYWLQICLHLHLCMRTALQWKKKKRLLKWNWYYSVLIWLCRGHGYLPVGNRYHRGI